MSNRGKRTRVATGIYADKFGYEIVVKRGGTPHSTRLPKNTTKAKLEKARADLLSHVLSTEPSAAPTGTLTKDIERWTKVSKHLVGWTKQRSHLRAFVRALGNVNRRELTRLDVLKVRSDWVVAKVKPKTINNRLSALRVLYHTLDGPDAPTPADRIAPLKGHRTPPQSIAAGLIAKVEAELQRQEQRGWLHDAKTRARFRVQVTSGARPSEIMRAERADIDFDHKVWRTRDGKGGFRPMGVPLTAEAIAAWHLFIEADAWGHYNTNSFARTLRTSGWPKGVRPYQLRHTIGLALSEADVDLSDVGTILGHRPGSRITAQTYVSPIWRRMQAAMAHLEGRVGFEAVPPGSATRKGRTLPKHAGKRRTAPRRTIRGKKAKVA